MNVITLAALALALVACGDSGDADTGTSDTSVDDTAVDDTSAGDTAVDDTPADDTPVDDTADAPSTELTDIQISVGDFVFDGIAAGPQDGTPVLLLHGFPQTSHAFRGEVEALGEAGYRAVAPDQRGYSPGARPAGVEAYDLTLLGQDIIDIADALGFDTFHLVGHDWGAAVTWYVGSAFADRVLTITPISVPHLDAFAEALNDPDSDQADRSAYFGLFQLQDSEDVLLADDEAGLRLIYDGLDEADIQVYIDALGTKEALGAALNWYRANNLDTAPGLASITPPTLFIWGDADVAVGPDAAYATADFVDGPYTLEVVEGGTHWLPELSFDVVDAALQAHIAE